MYTLYKENDESIKCRLVARGPMDNMLQIYTGGLTPIEAYTFFGNPDDLNKLIVSKINDETKEIEETHIMKGFTEIFAVQKPLIFIEDKKLILIVLRREPEVKPL